jgi:hypothetical protein
MKSAVVRAPSSTALRLARKSWRLLYSDSQQCIALAEMAFARAVARARAA